MGEVKNKTVLIGMTGRLDSTIAAYLLKKQGYNCIGIHIVFFDEAINENAKSYFYENDYFYGECYKKNLDNIKSVCESLEIPFYAINACSEYKARVLDYVVERRLQGRTFSPCIFCNEVKIDVLISKMEKLKADYVATGHYARIQEDRKHSDFNLMAANDIKFDQSYFLSTLSQKHLKNLLLPLSEIKKEEVQTIAKKLGINFGTEREIKSQMCFMRSKGLIKYVEDNSPKEMRKPGTFIKFREDSTVGDHEGIHHFYLGQDRLSNMGPIQIDPNYKVIQIDRATGQVYISMDYKISYTHLYLTNCHTISFLDKSAPIKIFAQLKMDAPRIPCILQFKNNNTAIIKFNSELSDELILGRYIPLFTKKDAGGKVLGGGFLDRFGDLSTADPYRLYMPDLSDDELALDENQDLMNNYEIPDLKF